MVAICVPATILFVNSVLAVVASEIGFTGFGIGGPTNVGIKNGILDSFKFTSALAAAVDFITFAMAAPFLK